MLKGSTDDSNIFPPGSTPYNTTYGEWLTKWWQWNIGIPRSIHPNFDYSSEACAVHQNGPVWFLPDLPDTNQAPITRDCTVPAGKAIGFIIESGQCDEAMGSEYSQTENPNANASLVTCASTGNDPKHVSMAASIDGVPINNLKQFRVLSDFFEISIPPENIYDSKPGNFRSVASGYMIILEPLSPGNHVIRYNDRVYFPDPALQTYNHIKDETFRIKVTE